jgi:hypothetical protein
LVRHGFNGNNFRAFKRRALIIAALLGGVETTSRSVTEASPFARTPLAISNSHFIGFNTTNILKISFLFSSVDVFVVKLFLSALFFAEEKK